MTFTKTGNLLTIYTVCGIMKGRVTKIYDTVMLSDIYVRKGEALNF